MKRTRTLLVVAAIASATAGGVSALSAPAGAAPAAPAVTGLSQHYGVWWGGQTITVSGRNLTGATQVWFGARQGYGLRVLSPTRLTIMNPDHANGPVHVRVVTRGGWSKKVAADVFRFRAATMDTPIYGGLTARQEQVISYRVRRAHRNAYIHPKAKSWTPWMGRTAIARARSWLGLPYSWAGGNGRGPTQGVCARNGGDNDCHVIGFDCSGLALYSWAPYRTLVHYAQTQKWQAGRFHPTVNQLVPGDLVYFSSSIPNGIGHTAIYEGNGIVIQAQQSGTRIMRSKLLDVIAASGTYRGATRPMTTHRQGPLPVVRSMTSKVSAAGGLITITGRNLYSSTPVVVGSSRLYRFVSRSNTRIVLKVAAHAPGRVGVMVSNAWGTAATRVLTYDGQVPLSPKSRTVTVAPPRDSNDSTLLVDPDYGRITKPGAHTGNRVVPRSAPR